MGGGYRPRFSPERKNQEGLNPSLSAITARKGSTISVPFERASAATFEMCTMTFLVFLDDTYGR